MSTTIPEEKILALAQILRVSFSEVTAAHEAYPYATTIQLQIAAQIVSEARAGELTVSNALNLILKIR